MKILSGVFLFVIVLTTLENGRFGSSSVNASVLVGSEDGPVSRELNLENLPPLQQFQEIITRLVKILAAHRVMVTEPIYVNGVRQPSLEDTKSAAELLNSLGAIAFLSDGLRNPDPLTRHAVAETLLGTDEKSLRLAREALAESYEVQLADPSLKRMGSESATISRIAEAKSTLVMCRAFEIECPPELKRDWMDRRWREIAGLVQQRATTRSAKPGRCNGDAARFCRLLRISCRFWQENRV